MGYNTDHYGEITIDPPLNSYEISYLNEFAGTRRMARTKGAYFVKGSGDFGQGQDADILNYNSTGPNDSPPEAGTAAEMPGLWCQWVPSEGGAVLRWDEGEKFYYSAEWMAYLINNFIGHGAFCDSTLGRVLVRLADEEDRFSHFVGHTCNGIIEAQGEDHDDKWRLVVKDNRVEVQRATIVWPA